MLLLIHVAAGGLAIVLGAVAAPGASSVADVLRAVHRGWMVLLDP
jgi:hypothetical protein